ncbi:Acyltransferase LovD [Cytospora mali]|uniref:Acyltransferase LovD n=1 Tax=Cytospora mali TaxID=578113 RepID=A0A194V2G4_CYTMA|nr:Acyltransferase LovD [Valsa mali var. pyri (nom. inval.)]
MVFKLETVLKELVDTKKIPNAILYASDANGDFQYHSIFGFSSPEANAPALTEDDYLFSASCTKLLTSISVLKLVEDGRLSLDDAVDGILPELAKLEIITKAEPVLEYQTPKNKITYRQLLMHTSGLSYDFVHPYLAAWRKENPSEGESVPKRFNFPLVFEPGTAWVYGCGLDWAGLAVERISGMALSEFMTKNIFDPVGVNKDGITFFPLKVPGAQLVTMAARTGDSSFVTGINTLQGPSVEHCYGGQGAYLRGREYMQILRSLLADDEKLLKRATVAEMVRPQLDAAQKGPLNDLIFAYPVLERTMSRDIDRGKVDHSLCGVVDVEGQPGWRGKGTVLWGGSPNLNWFLDRDRDLCGFLGAQLIPSGDPVYKALNLSFEKTMYKLAGKNS